MGWHQIGKHETGIVLVCGDDPVEILSMAMKHVELLWFSEWGRWPTQEEINMAWKGAQEGHIFYDPMNPQSPDAGEDLPEISELGEVHQKLLDLVDGNARVINEIYDSVMTLRKAVAIVQTLLEEQLEDPEEQLKKVGIRHAEWDGESPHPYGCDGLEDDPDDDAGGSADIEPETTADKGTLSALETEDR
jgi:hypothetical protein